MKRFLILLLLLVLSPFKSMASRMPETAGTLPLEIAHFLQEHISSDYTITAFTTVEGTETGDYAFAIAVSERQNILYGFEHKDGSWQYWLVNAMTLPQQEGTFTLTGRQDYAFSVAPALSGRVQRKEPVLQLNWLSEDRTTQYIAFYSTTGSSGQWRLRQMMQHSTRSDVPVFSIEVDQYALTYHTGNASETVRGTVQNNLRYHSLSSFPLTIAQARHKLSLAPELPDDSTLQAQTLSFPGGQKHPVYSGPGTQYLRAANGKAMVSTNDWIQVFGRESDYLFIQYAVASDRMRFGYMNAASLPKGVQVPSCSFSYSPTVMAADASLTDDPLFSASPLMQLQEGQAVLLLATFKDYAYIEVNTAPPVRGFVKENKLKREEAPTVLEAQFSDQDFILSAVLTLKEDKISVQVQAEGKNPAHCPRQFLLLGNQTLLCQSEGVMSDDISIHDGQTVYTASCLLETQRPPSVQLIGLCPVMPDGPAYDKSIIFLLP